MGFTQGQYVIKKSQKDEDKVEMVFFLKVPTAIFDSAPVVKRPARAGVEGNLARNIPAVVLHQDGGVLPNLFAGGGAACGVSGPEVWGYSSGNGLLTAVVLGRVAGEGAVALIS